jgi:hypothetical protein
LKSSNKKEGCTVNDITHSNKFKIGKMTSIGHSKCVGNCGFGKKKKVVKKVSLKQLLKDLKCLKK